jgi:hypothetical protein
MGTTPVDNSPAHRWGPPTVLVVIAWLGTVAALWWLLAEAPDAGSKLFAGLSVLVLAGCALYGTRARPRLVATSRGIEVRGMAGRQDHPWPDVRDIRLLTTPGLGRRTLTLEITVHVGPEHDDERLFIFSRLDLGVDPRDVIDELSELRAAG